MQKYKYALDLKGNIYFLTSDFNTYKLSNDEIKKLHSEPISDTDTKYIGKEIIYDHTYIYVISKEFIEQYKLHNNQKIKLYEDIGKIKIKEINPENIKDISFILHHILKIKGQEEADVQGYEMPISSSWQYIPFNQRMNFGIENVLNRQNIFNRQNLLNPELSGEINDIINISDDINFSGYDEQNNSNNFSINFLDFGNSLQDYAPTPQPVPIPDPTSNTKNAIPIPTPTPPPYPEYPILNIDGKKVNVKDMANSALNLALNDQYVSEDGKFDRSKGYVCIDVPHDAYQSQIDITGAMQKAAVKNPTAYTFCSGDPSEDGNLLRRVQNWEQFFKDGNLHTKYYNHKDYADNNLTIPRYQVGDVLFIAHGDDPEPDHSAIVTKIDPYTGIPTEVVAASFRYHKVTKFTWDEWNRYLNENPKGRIVAHGGFRPDEKE